MAQFLSHVDTISSILESHIRYKRFAIQFIEPSLIKILCQAPEKSKLENTGGMVYLPSTTQ